MELERWLSLKEPWLLSQRTQVDSQYTYGGQQLSELYF